MRTWIGPFIYDCRANIERKRVTFVGTCKVFVPYGALGTGITKKSFEKGIELRPDIISCDAGSTDSGPYYLGTGKSKYAREAIKEDLRLMVVGANKLSIPITIGTAGTCGTDASVDALSDICEEICKEEGIQAKIAKIYSQQCAQVLKTKYKEGKIHPLEAAPEISSDTFDQCTNIVALAGAEPFIKALEEGADIVICGRATDTAIIAAMPILRGCNEAAAWHGAKTVECGSLCTTNPSGGGVFITFDEEGFVVEPTNDDSKCTVYSVSAHMLYENADPFQLREPSGILDTRQCQYTQLNERRVRVTGSAFTHMPYTMKLEGSGPVGFQTITLVGIQDQRIMADPMKWLDSLTNYVSHKLAKLSIPESEFSYDFKLYGYNAVSGTADPERSIPKEVGLLLTVTGKTQEIATKVAKLFNPYLLHFPVKLEEQLPTFAFPFSPAEIEKGQIFEFKLNHVVDVSYPLELIRIEYVDSNGIQEGRE